MCFYIVYELIYGSEVGIKVVQVAPQAVGIVRIAVCKSEQIEIIGLDIHRKDIMMTFHYFPC
jgi:hypothetical protein